MAGVRKPTPIEVFEDNMAGAAQLIRLTKALLNTRPYRMRKERRETVGTALGIPKRHWKKLDWVESPDAYVILKPDGEMTRKAFTEQELRPLLRQAVVAVAAAVESYVAEKAATCIGDALDLPPDRLPERLKAMAVSFGDVMDIEARLQRRRWGYRELVRQHLVAEASSNPAKIGIVFSTVGKKSVLKAADGHRGVRSGMSERQLKALSDRRNRIAHTGDRVGRGHATLDIGEVEAFYMNAKEIIEALEIVL